MHLLLLLLQLLLSLPLLLLLDLLLHLFRNLLLGFGEVILLEHAGLLEEGFLFFHVVRDDVDEVFEVLFMEFGTLVVFKLRLGFKFLVADVAVEEVLLLGFFVLEDDLVTLLLLEILFVFAKALLLGEQGLLADFDELLLELLLLLLLEQLLEGLFLFELLLKLLVAGVTELDSLDELLDCFDVLFLLFLALLEILCDNDALDLAVWCILRVVLVGVGKFLICGEILPFGVEAQDLVDGGRGHPEARQLLELGVARLLFRVELPVVVGFLLFYLDLLKRFSEEGVKA